MNSFGSLVQGNMCHMGLIWIIFNVYCKLLTVFYYILILIALIHRPLKHPLYGAL